ncbi:type II toxin-antitoxin system VapC family toxin [Methylobacterium sp. W2]|uniref:type II toxin-antitoxin system VapC family toxin n=1 Tax=Methylobacterium sp. W2 TaxID=2598107 RepID=UPI001D0CAC23|nr:type II toxin-antitoxin system VapC family toxin [Methylobacterium sp. W2]MCC0804892.1 type II toxin-antitoxin system VapC family toxin [Methylobacterium sp. W2]
MIVLDTSAIVAIALSEPEEWDFNRLIARRKAVVGAPTLVEARMVLDSRIPDAVVDFLGGFSSRPAISVLSFDARMYELACDAFARFGKGRGHPARLNFGDCMSYAVARHTKLPLLFKGDDFGQTDIPSAWPLTR